MNNITSLPVTLSLNLSRTLVLLASTLLFAVLGGGFIYLRFAEGTWVWLPIGAFFACMAFAAMLGMRSKLTLTSDGFVLKRIFKDMQVRWQDVEDFIPVSQQSIGWNYVPEYSELSLMRKLNRSSGTEASIPGQFGGMSAVDLAILMNKLRIASQSVPPLTAEQKFGLAVSAILTELNGQRHDCLYGDMPGYSLKVQMREMLSEYWGISNAKEMYETLNWLNEEGHRAEYEAMHEALSNAGNVSDPLQLLEKETVEKMSKDEQNGFQLMAAFVSNYGEKHPSILAWDLCRLVSVARFGVGAEYITEMEAWKWILDAALKLQTAFGSWQEMSENYIVGREFWGNHEAREQVKQIQLALLDVTNSESPWNHIPWNTELKGTNSSPKLEEDKHVQGI